MKDFIIMSFLAILFNLFPDLWNIIMTWAPTANFKCCCDSWGNDAIKNQSIRWTKVEQCLLMWRYIDQHYSYTDNPKSKGFMKYRSTVLSICICLITVRLFFDESDSKIIEVESDWFKNDRSRCKNILCKSQCKSYQRYIYPMKATKQTHCQVLVEHLTHALSVRKTHYHCSKCWQFKWNERTYIQKGLESAFWLDKDISLIATEKNFCH